MRLFLTLLFLASPATAWEFSPSPVCTLAHDGPAGTVTVTYDPGAAEPYAIAIARAGAAWPDAPVFGIRFDGPRGLTITTDRHRLSDEQSKLTVSDRGFGNVLNGLEFNSTATARAGEAEVTFSLEGAAPEVQAFRACTKGGIA